jgi:hypothetical protein
MATIKKTILLALTALMLVGCDIREKTTIEGNWTKEKSWSEIVKENRRIRDSIEQKWYGFEVVVIDSCEYIRKELIGYKKAAFETVHKGNCRFCKERRQKEMKELVEQLKEK